ncbi:MAG: CerR family C-terminal domain-containing protein [Deltaproteobacteria bacterium]|nr:CerR family C-terminal domain-containing protein [Deltaproteobacteria bacterium]
MRDSRRAAAAATLHGAKPRSPRARATGDADVRSAGTRERLLGAAAEVFAARGYRGATMREIAERARANLASAHYHFGSKENLYLEISNRQFEMIERRIAAAGARLPAAEKPVPPRATLERMFAARVRALLELLLSPANPHGTLMLRELCDPSEALPVILERFIEPLRCDMDRVVSTFAPRLSREQIDLCTRSVVAQIYFYVSHRPVILQMTGRTRYPRDFVRSVADHVSRFSLAGIDAIAAEAGRRPVVRRVRAARRGAA